MSSSRTISSVPPESSTKVVIALFVRFGWRCCASIEKATETVATESSSARLSNDLSEYRADRGRIQGHELERKRDELVHGGSDSPQIEILQDRGVSRKKHVVHGKVLAVSGID